MKFIDYQGELKEGGGPSQYLSEKNPMRAIIAVHSSIRLPDSGNLEHKQLKYKK